MKRPSSGSGKRLFVSKGPIHCDDDLQALAALHRREQSALKEAKRIALAFTFEGQNETIPTQLSFPW